LIPTKIFIGKHDNIFVWIFQMNKKPFTITKKESAKYIYTLLKTALSLITKLNATKVINKPK